MFLNYLANYVPNSWSEEKGCSLCNETLRPLPPSREEWPVVLVAMSIPSPTPFLLEVLERVLALDYPQERMGLFVHNEVKGGGGGGVDRCVCPHAQ